LLFLFKSKFFFFFKNLQHFLNKYNLLSWNNTYKKIKVSSFNKNINNLHFYFKKNVINSEIKQNVYTKNFKLLNEEYFLMKFINLFFFFNYSVFNFQFQKTHFLNFFFFKDFSGGRTIIINFKKFLLRLKNSINLMFNLFFYKLNPLIYTTIFFKKQVVSLNWNLSNWTYKFWRYSFFFFLLKWINIQKKLIFFWKN